jgi:hypothetical protein
VLENVVDHLPQRSSEFLRRSFPEATDAFERRAKAILEVPERRGFIERPDILSTAIRN